MHKVACKKTLVGLSVLRVAVSVCVPTAYVRARSECSKMRSYVVRHSMKTAQTVCAYNVWANFVISISTDVAAVAAGDVRFELRMQFN